MIFGDCMWHANVFQELSRSRAQQVVKLRSGRRMDALTENRVGAEVERQGPKGIRNAVSRLKEAKSTKVALGAKIAVPNNHMRQAGAEMRKQGVSGRVQNLSNSKAFYVKPTRLKPSRKSARRSTSR